MRSKVSILGSQPLAYSLPVLTTDAKNQIPSKQCPQLSRRMQVTNHAWLLSKVIEHVVSQIPNKIDTVYIVSDGCASQFRSKFVFKLLTLIFPEMNIECHYNEARHGKGPMDGIGGAVKNTVFRKVLSGEAKTAMFFEFKVVLLP